MFTVILSLTELVLDFKEHGWYCIEQPTLLNLSHTLSLQVLSPYHIWLQTSTTYLLRISTTFYDADLQLHTNFISFSNCVNLHTVFHIQNS